MPTCPSCRTEVSEQSRICEDCGESLARDGSASATSNPAPRADASADDSQDLTATESPPSQPFDPSTGAGPTADGTPAADLAASEPSRYGDTVPAVDESLLRAASVSARLASSRAQLGPRTTRLERFPPGTLIAQRYRVIRQLGCGGMGDVYLADDLTLEQPVALKFLAHGLANDPHLLGRFCQEVRIARQVSHTGVCRIFDIGEHGEDAFISMEYVDGEDLSCLLRRIGRLSQDKGLDIARQLCAAVAAAHARGVLHRDLKPANVMIDGEGHVRVMDFGLAGIAEQIADIRSGTPAYQAPEQLTGDSVSLRSDLYALGLVLYEIFTGRRAFHGNSANEIRDHHLHSTPSRPSSFVRDLDPAIERVILRCLAKDPADRPSSAVAVAAALPGGDPLAAALAAGETPSPELVAASGRKDGLKPSLAVALLALNLAGLAMMTWLAPMFTVTGLSPMGRPPEALADRAAQMLVELGHDGPFADDAHGYFYDRGYLQELAAMQTEDAWRRLSLGAPPAVVFWYRQCEQDFVTVNNLGVVTWSDPPINHAGMRSVQLDPTGRLLALRVTPPAFSSQWTASPPPDWPDVFNRAGLELSAFTPDEPLWTPSVFADARYAWTGGAYDCQPEIPIRVEAGTYKGRLTYFNTWGRWVVAQASAASASDTTAAAASFDVRGVARNVLNFGVLIGGVLLATVNFRRGRGDLAGATRLAVFMAVVRMAMWLLLADHAQSVVAERRLFMRALSDTLLEAGFCWVFYVAVEPYVRRLWPQTIVSWTRLLSGSYRDPMVGRDILLGGLMISLVYMLEFIHFKSAAWLGLPPPEPLRPDLDAILGVRQVAGAYLAAIPVGLQQPVVFLLLLLLLRVVLRKEWLALIALVVVLALTYPSPFQGGNLWVDVALRATIGSLMALLMLRFGLLVLAFGFVFYVWLFMFPLTSDFSQWYARQTFVAVVVAGGIMVYGFIASLGGQRLVSERWLEPEAAR